MVHNTFCIYHSNNIKVKEKKKKMDEAWKNVTASFSEYETNWCILNLSILCYIMTDEVVIHLCHKNLDLQFRKKQICLW